MSRYKTVEVRPSMGGRLMTDVSKDSVGVINYTVKRDFRRELDVEVRSEGYDKFRPNTVPTALATQHLPAGATGDALELIVEGLRANGQRELIVGTKTTLWKFAGLDNGCFVDPTYVDLTYFQSVELGEWLVIGSGFSRDGRRWEAEQVGDYLVLNNAVDLPVTYRIQDAKVAPIYELRENGVASVGTIASLDGILVCGDIRLVDDATLASIMALKDSGTTASQVGVANSGAVRASVNNGAPGVAGNRVTATSAVFVNTDVGRTIRMANGLTRTITALIGGQPTATVTVDGAADLAEPDQPYYWPGANDFVVNAAATVPFTTDMVGLKLVWGSGEVREIVTVNSSTQVVVDQDGPIASGAFKLENSAAYGAYTDIGKIDRFQYRLFWAMPDLPRRFAATVPGSIDQGQNFVRLDYPAKSIEPGMMISIPGAGLAGSTLKATVVYVSAAHHLLAIDEFASAGVVSGLIQATDSVDSIVSFEDLVDDGSAIVRAMALRSTLVIYREASIYLAVFTGDVEKPFQFSRPIPTEHSLFHRNTLVSVTPVQGGVPFHLYAGRASFYRFDLITKSPAEVTELHLVKNVFFEDANGPGYVLGPELVPYSVVLNGNPNAPTVTGVLDGAGQGYLVRDQDGTEHVDLVGAIGAREWNTPPTISLRKTLARREDRIFAAENALTREVFFFFPGSGSDRAIRYNYRDGTVSTTSMDVSAASMTRRSLSPGEQANRYEDWFVLGTSNGTLFRYGLLLVDSISSGTVKATKSGGTVTANDGFFEPRHVGRSIFFPGSKKIFAITSWTSPVSVGVVAGGNSDDVTAGEVFTILPAIYHRDGMGYESVLASGLEAFGSSFKEKEMNGYVLVMGSRNKGMPVRVSVVGAVNPSEPATLGTKVIDKPNTQNLVPVAFVSNYFGDEIKVTGVNNPVEIAGRSFSVAGIEGGSFNRRPR